MKLPKVRQVFFAPFGGVRRRLLGLRLFWKLLIPFLLVVLLMGCVGAFFTVRFLSTRAQDELTQDLFRRSLETDVFFRDQALGLLDSLRFAANISGVPEALEARDEASARRLLGSVLAVRSDLDLLIATDTAGRGLVEILRTARGLVVGQGHPWGDRDFVAKVLRGTVVAGQDKRSGLLRTAGTNMLATAGPVRARGIVGTIVAARRVDEIVMVTKGGGATVSLYDVSGAVVGSSASGKLPSPPAVTGGTSVRRTERIGGVAVDTLYGPFDIQNERIGTLAVSLPRGPAFAGVSGATLRLAIVLVLAMAAVFGLGALVSRLLLAQLKRLVDAARSWGNADLGARAEVTTTDELGQLAESFNTMAEQLEATYAELEAKVAMRTEELQVMYQDLTRMTEARSEFFAGISHEFRTPLFAIMTHADMMLDRDFKPKDNRWRAEFAETIKGSAEDLLARVNEILDLAKLESGKMQVEMQEVVLQDVVKDLSRTIGALAHQSNLAALIEVDRSIPMVRADPARLRQVLMNLVSNAIKYTPAGGRVRVSAAMRNGGPVEVQVADTGVGIPDEAAPNVFEPFYQVAGTTAQKGQASSGLGLALTKRLVEAQGGSISFKSEVGKGTTFTFTLDPVGEAGPRRKKAKT
jgi:signal transduction histidine kinase